MSPTLQSKFLTIGPPGKPRFKDFLSDFLNISVLALSVSYAMYYTSFSSLSLSSMNNDIENKNSLSLSTYLGQTLACKEFLMHHVI